MRVVPSLLLLQTSSMALVPLSFQQRVLFPRSSTTRVFAVTEEKQKSPMIIEITANNIEMTPALRRHVEEKLDSSLKRYESLINRCETHLTVNKNSRVPDGHSCEVVIFTSDRVIRAEERTSSMYASIDLVSHKLARKLRKLKDKKVKTFHKPKVSLKTSPEALFEDTIAEETEDEDMTEADLKFIARRKQFDFQRQTVDEAVESMEDVDHDFYLFTNSDTGTLNVIYKRKSGGLGLIEPKQQQQE